MRNRLTQQSARISAVLVTVPLALLLAAGSASADQVHNTAVADGVPFGIAGPVGVIAVVLGFGGLIIGLFRRRRLATARAIPAAVAARRVGAVALADREPVA